MVRKFGNIYIVSNEKCMLIVDVDADSIGTPMALNALTAGLAWETIVNVSLLPALVKEGIARLAAAPQSVQ